MSITQIFLQQTDNFNNDLVNIFPNNGEILVLQQKYNFIRSANSKLIIEYFIEFIFPYKEKIKNKDEDFFIEGGGQSEIKNKSGLKLKDNIKTLWLNQMSSDNKEIIWKYFNVFALLCGKYIAERQ